MNVSVMVHVCQQCMKAGAAEYRCINGAAPWMEGRRTHLVVWRRPRQPRQVVIVRIGYPLELSTQFPPRLFQGQLVLHSNVALWDVLHCRVRHLVSDLHGQVVGEIQKTDLANVLRLGNFLADDGGLVACITAWSPTEFGVRPLADMTFGPVLHLHPELKLALDPERASRSWPRT